MPKLGELNFKDPSLDAQLKKDDDDDIGVIRSTLSGIASGVFKIPEGAFSLGANLLDFGLGTNTAASVEKFFDTINPFDEAAEATTAGRIAELIVNIGVPGGIAFKAGKNLSKAAIAAKQSGNYFTLTGKGLADDVISKGVPKATKFNIAPISKAVEDLALNKKGKVLEYAGGAGLGGVAEGIFVGDVDKAGTLGDLLGGPTKLDRETGGTNRDKAARELANRLKFGIEGGAFTGALGVAGVGFRRLRQGPTDTGRVITDPMEKYWNKVFSYASKRGQKGKTTFEATEAIRSGLAANQRLGIDAAETINRNLENLGPKMEKYWSSEDGLKEMAKKKEALNKTFVSDLDKPKYFDKQLTKTGRDSGFTLEEILSGKPLKYEKSGELVTAAEKARFVEDGFTLKFNNITDEGFKPFEDALEQSKRFGKGKPIQEVKDNIRFEMDLVRNKWGDLYSSYGRLLRPEELTQFKTAFKSKINEFVDSGAKIFNDKTIGTLKIYPPSRPIIQESVDQIVKASRALGAPLTDDNALRIVERIYNNATLEKGFNLKQNSGIFFRDIPRLFTDSLAGAIDDASKLTTYQKTATGRTLGANLSSIKDVKLPDGSIFERRKLLENLIGKSKDGLNTIITGTERIANLVVRNEVNNEIVRNSLKQKQLVDDYLTKVDDLIKGGKSEAEAIAEAGPRPTAPTVVDNSFEAEKYFGGTKGIMGTGGERSTGDFVQMNFDSDLAPIKGLKSIGDETIEVANESSRLTNNLDGKFALTGNADALVRGDITQDSKLLGYSIYRNLILYPKAGAQLAKTVLGPVTHMRNFLSAAAFAGANGVLLNNELGALKKAWNSSMGPALAPIKLGKEATPEAKAFYNKLLNLGVVNTNVTLGDVTRLMKDVRFGEFDFQGKTLNNIMSLMARGKKFAQDAYTAEDDFWKIFTWLGEKTRIDKAFRDMADNNQLAKGEDIIQVMDDGTLKNLGKLNDEWIENRAADLVKNNVPNYAYVSDFVKGLRQYPVGNFVSFPAEIMRTSTNIIDTALEEINFTIQLPKRGADGQFIKIKPLRSVGLQRLRGMALTTAIVPTGIATAAEMLYDVSKDEIEALRRYVPSWSKNSTLVPIRNEDGKLSYVDFSRMNAYDLLLRPIQSVINSVESGNTDRKGIMKDFIAGMSEATKELASPFIESSLWVSALQDVLPTQILGRGGLDSEGRRIWNPNDAPGNKIYAILGNLVEALAPLNANQLNRLFKSALPQDSMLSLDKYGRRFDLGKELAGMVGLRAVDVKPESGIKYKINQFQKDVRNSRSLFTGKLLKGGPVSAEELVDAYINANRALYETNRSLYKDVEAAKVLGLSGDSIEAIMDERGVGKTYEAFENGEFRPYNVSNAVKELFEINAAQINAPDPMQQAEDVIDRIQEVLESTSITSSSFPDIENPFNKSLLPEINLGSTPVGQLPPVITGADTNVVAQNARFGSVPFTSLPEDKQLEEFNKVFPNG
jgi:hypothetical protein